MFQIVTDGSCDLEQALVEQYQLHVVPFYITKDGLTHQKEKEDISDFKYRYHYTIHY